MNNERYLFRGKTYEGQWVYGDLIHGVGRRKGNMFILPRQVNMPHECSIYGWDCIPATIGQFTGITDKNGVKVFEGDKIKHPKATEPEHLGWTIEWYDFKWIGRNIFNPKFTCVLSDYFTQCELIGSIHDNDKAVNP